MITVQDMFGAFFVALIIAYGFTPFAKQIAFKTRLLDEPNNQKKSHAHPTPLLGGLAIYLAFFTGAFFTTGLNNYIYAIFIGSTILFSL